MKKSHLTISSFIVLAFIVPQITFAAWWNPISWFNSWSFFNRTDPQTQVLENRVKELEARLEMSVQTSTAVPATSQNRAANYAPNEQTVKYTNPAKESNQLKLESCIDDAEREYNHIVLDLSEQIRDGLLDKSYFAPSVNGLEKRKAEQKADCVTKYK